MLLDLLSEYSDVTNGPTLNLLFVSKAFIWFRNGLRQLGFNELAGLRLLVSALAWTEAKEL